MGSDEIITAYQHSLRPPAQDPSLPGLDAEIDPTAEWTRLEVWDNDGKPHLVEYEGSGRLKGKRALITGGDSGIGRAAAVMFAREGADVSIVYLPEEQVDADWVKKKIEEAGQKCLLIPGDISSRAFCQELVKKHIDAFGGLEILVNNAAKQQHCEHIKDMDLDFSQETFQVNIIAQLAITKFAIPYMKRGASIINTTSIGAYSGDPMAVKLDYGSTKGAIVSFTRALAIQQAPHGIRANCVAPGPVWTPLNPATDKQPKEVIKDLGYKETPLWGRMIQPAELGPSYVFLADSRASNAVTGQTIHVHSGMWTGS